MIIYFVLIWSLIRVSGGETNGQVQRLHDLQHAGTVIHMGKRYNNGNVLTSVVTLGIQMCVHVCLKTSGCGLVNFDTRELLCEMIKADDSVNAAYLVNSQWDIFASVSSSSNVSPCGTCNEGQSCELTSQGNVVCAKLQQQCGKTYYLVTGEHGVTSDRVTWSTVYPGVASYQLNSSTGWAANRLNKNQYIQVEFTQTKIVDSIVTRGRPPGGTQYVTSYHAKYYDHGTSSWEYIREPDGIIKVFPGNGADAKLQINSLPVPLRTSGIKIKPQTWVNYITLQFDVLGC